MSMTLLCPGCNVRLSVGDDSAGSTFDCPKCFTRISVPVLEPLPAPPAEPPREVDYDSEPEPERKRLPRKRDLDPDPYYRPARRKKKGLDMVAVTGVAILGALALIMVIVAVSARRDRADAHKAKRTDTTADSRISPTPTRSARSEASRPPESQPSERTARDDDRGSVGELIFRLFLLVSGLAFYFTPTIIAIARGHNNIAPIAVVNFFLGWLLIGWVIALAWAFTDLKHLERKRRSYL